MEKNENDGLFEIRATQKKLQKAIRVQRKSECLKHNRKELQEIEKSSECIGVHEMTKLAGKLCKSKNQIEIIRRIKNAACLSDLHIEAFFRVQNSLKSLVSILCRNESNCQLEAAACLTNLATGPHKCTQKIATAAGAYLITHMQGESTFLQSQCAWIAGNIANDCERCFLILKMQGLTHCLQSLLKSHNPEVVESAVFALNACSKYDSIDISDELAMSMLLLGMFERTDLSHHTHVESTFILANICLKFNQETQLKLANGLLIELKSKIVSIDDLDVLLATPGIRCLTNLSSSIELCHFLINHETFQQIVSVVMNCSYHHLKTELLCALTNIATCDAVFQYTSLWQEVLRTLKPFISPLDGSVMQALYLLCVLKSQWSDFEKEYVISGLDASALCHCGKEEIETAATFFCSVMH